MRRWGSRALLRHLGRFAPLWAAASGVALFLPPGLHLGCARTAPTPPALVAAHTALQRAQLGPAREQAPAFVARAEVGFATARATCAKDPRANSCRDWCYVAERRAERAVAEAQVALAHRAHKRAHLALAALRAQAAHAGGLAPARGPEAPAGPADLAAHLALSAKAPAAQARQEPGRGLVVRLAPVRAFARGSSRLLPRARRELRQVAQALQDEPRGVLQVTARAEPANTNNLARARTQAVVAHLMACGLPATRLLAQVPNGESAAVCAPAQGDAAARREGGDDGGATPAVHEGDDAAEQDADALAVHHGAALASPGEAAVAWGHVDVAPTDDEDAAAGAAAAVVVGEVELVWRSQPAR